MSPPSALIVGAGIGGLATALALAHKGLRVTLLEQASAFGDVGAGIQVSPNATRVLFELGLEKPLAAVAFRPEGVEIRTWRPGNVLSRVPLGDQAPAHV